jgi:hypothetical protein
LISGIFRDYCLLHFDQTCSGTRPSSYSVCTWDSLPGREVGHSFPPHAEIKRPWSYTSTSPYVFMAWCLIKQSDKFVFTFHSSSRHRDGGDHLRTRRRRKPHPSTGKLPLPSTRVGPMQGGRLCRSDAGEYTRRGGGIRLCLRCITLWSAAAPRSVL